MNATPQLPNKTLNILMITHHMTYKAIYRSQIMAKNLANNGHYVTLMTIANERKFGTKEIEWEGINSVETPDLLWGRLRSGWDIWNIINRIFYLTRKCHRFDLVHCFETRPATIYPALIHSRINHLPILTDWNDWWGRGGIINELRPKWYRYIFGGLETYFEEAFRTRGIGVTVISTALRERAIQLGVSPERVRRIPGGVDTDFFQPFSKKNCCQRVKLQFQGPVLCFSSLDSHLDLELIFQSLIIVSQIYPNVRLIITGKIDNSGRNLIRKYDIENLVFLTGFLPFEDLPWYLGCADIFLMPLDNKIHNIARWPNKVGNYMSMGRPTVSNPVGDIKKLFESDEVGLLADWNPADFAQKILTLIENPDLAQQIGLKAREIAVSKYDWRIITKRLEEFYCFLLGKQAKVDGLKRDSWNKNLLVQ